MEKLTIGLIGGTLSAGLIYLGIKEEIFYLFLILIILDFITGIIKGFMHKNLKSETALKGIIKKTSILFLLLSVAIILKIFNIGNPQDYIYTMLGAISLVELYSIIGNIYGINYGEKISEFDALKLLLRVGSGIVKTTIETQVKTGVNSIEIDEKIKQEIIKEHLEKEKNKEKK